jgi:pSer/pThr/pTyr-binding forkhead associated (FHA) protein
MAAQRPPHIVVQLVHIAGPMKGQIQEYTEGIISIGRHPTCHLRFPADLTSVSRQHAEIIREGNRFKLVDHSTNGTFVNGKRATEAFLKSGDVLAFSEVGPKVSFLADIREGAAAAAPTPAPTPAAVPEAPRARSAAPLPPPEPSTPSPPVKTPPPPAAPPSIPATIKVPLIVQYGATLRSFRELPVTIGKGAECQVVLEHPALQARHAQILFAEDRYWVRDLTGLRSVQVNGRPVGDQAPLDANDELALTPKGPVFRFLGEGRLAEMPGAPPEEASPKIEGETPQSGTSGSKPRKGLLSKFRKS